VLWRGSGKLRVTLNLASRPFADLGPAIKRLRIAMAVLAVVAIGLGLGLRALHHKAELARAHDHSSTARSPASPRSARASRP